ncbi:MAG: phage major capsid protein [Akkermansiaceae bacterium]
MNATLSAPRAGEMLHRTIDLGRAAVNATERTIEIAFSSEAPVERYFGTEILDHSPKSVRLGRLNNGGAVLLEHDRNRQIGVIVSARIDSDRVGRAVIRFGKGPLAEEIFQDVKDGIRRLVSVGYRIHSQETESKTAGVEAVRVTDWEPYELSLVAIPADDSVGVGRGLSDPTSISNYPNKVNTPTIDPAANERTRTTRILEMAAQGQRQGITVDANRAIAEGLSPDQFREQLYNSLMSRQTSYEPARSAPEFSRSEQRDMSRYSVCRAIHMAGQGRLDGLEAEISQELARSSGKAPSGFYLPHSVLMQSRAMSVTGDAGIYGGQSVETMVTGFIDALRPMLACARAGATIMSGLTSNVGIPRHKAASTATWKAENAELDEKTQEIEQLVLTPKRIGAWTKLSKQLVVQSSLDVENFVRRDLMEAIAVGFDYAAINGTGTSDQPRGILNTTGIGSVAGGSNGLAPTFSHLNALVAAVANANALAGRPGFVFSTKIEAKLRGTVKAPLTETLILEEGQATLAGQPWLSSNNAPDNLTKGTSSGVCSAIIFGNWQDLILASFGGGCDVVVDSVTLATTNQTRVIVNCLADVGVRRPASFASMKDALSA